VFRVTPRKTNSEVSYRNRCQLWTHHHFRVVPAKQWSALLSPQCLAQVSTSMQCAARIRRRSPRRLPPLLRRRLRRLLPLLRIPSSRRRERRLRDLLSRRRLRSLRRQRRRPPLLRAWPRTTRRRRRQTLPRIMRLRPSRRRRIMPRSAPATAVRTAIRTL
jgi:hypothetical protein